MSTKSAAVAPAKKAIGSKNTEIIIGASARKLTMAVKAIEDAKSEVGKLDEVAQECVLKVTNLEDKIGGLEVELQNKTAQNKIELKQAYDTDRKSYVDQYLTEHNSVMIEGTELQKLKDAVSKAESNTAAEVSKAVNAATNSMKKDNENAVAILKLEHEKKEANNLSEIKQLQAQVTFLSEQLKTNRELLESQMKNETERSKHGAINTLNVGDTSKTR